MEKSGEYFNKNKEPVGSAEALESVEIPGSLLKPLAKELFFEDASGKNDNIQEPFAMHIEGEDLALDIKYSSSKTSEVKDKLIKYNNIEKIDDKDAFFEARILEGFIMKDRDGHVLNLNSLLEKKQLGQDSKGHPIDKRDITVVFDSTQESPGSNKPDNEAEDLGTAFVIDNTIFIKNNISVPATIIAMLHEVGHIMKPSSEKIKRYRDYFRSGNKNLLDKTDIANPHLNEDIADQIIASERNAWAYAINKIRPFIYSGFIDKDDLLKYVHEYALGSYSYCLDKFLNPNIKDRITRGICSAIATFLNFEQTEK